MIEILRFGVAGLLGCVGAIAFSILPTFPQLTPDNTLGIERSVVIPINKDNDRIGGGAARGVNLFHSFQDFNVGVGRGVYFANPQGITNIFSRVTGGNSSNIFGKLGVLGDANLFLLNPNGIVFGKNASLDVQGSFLGTTANAVQFGNQGVFSATNPEAAPLLTINPSALLFNQINQNAAIQNNSVAPAGKDPGGVDVFGLRVPDGKSLLLVGGNISMDGGRLTANGGRVEMAGLAASGNVELNVAGDTLSLSVPSDVQRGNISLTNQAFVDVSGAGKGDIAVNAGNFEMSSSFLLAGISAGLGDGSSKGGDINIKADAISLTNGAQINAFTNGKGDAGNIFIAARDLIFLNSGFITNFVLSDGVGNAGNIKVQAGNILAKNQGEIVSATQGKGNSGSISIAALNTISLDNGSILSNVLSRDAEGNAGNIDIQAGNLFIKNGGAISSSTYGKGNSGNISITSGDAISLDASNIYNNVQSRDAEGNAGKIDINTGSLSLTNGAQINSFTRGHGNAGNITVQARDAVSFDGKDSNGNESGLLSIVGDDAIGNGGTVSITSGSLSLNNTGRLGVYVSDTSDALQGKKAIAGTANINVRDAFTISGKGSGIFASLGSGVVGRGGDVNIQAGNLFIQDAGGISSFLGAGAVGQSGDINIQAGNLFIKDGGAISSSTYGKGNSGNISITSGDAISLDASNIYNNVQSRDAEGNAGKIDINTGSLSLTNGAQINSFTRGRGNAGNITVQARDTVSFDGKDSGLLSVVGDDAIGNGGTVSITSGSLSLNNTGRLGVYVSDTSDALQGKKAIAGTANINVRDAFTISGKGSGIFASLGSGVVGRGGDVNIQAGNLFIQDAGGISSFLGAGAVGQSGDINIQAGNLFIKDGGAISSSTYGKGNSGNISITSGDVISLDAGSSIVNNVQSRDAEGNAGKIDINTGSLSLTNGAQINSFTRGRGNAGNITVQARDAVSFDGVDNDKNRSGSFSSVETGAIGNGGRINITAGSLSLTNSGKLGVSVNKADEQLPGGQGIGGNININVRDAFTISGTDSGIDAFLGAGAVGQSGDVNIQAGNLFIKDGDRINSSTFGKGDSGNISITTGDAISLDASNIVNNVQSRDAEGNAGNIDIKTGSLSLTNGAQINSLTRGRGNAGNITVQARDAVSFDGFGSNGLPSASFSNVDAGAVGNGGRINITAGSLSLTNSGKLGVRVNKASKQLPGGQGIGGNLNINVRDAFTISGTDSGIDASLGAGAVGESGDVNIQAENLFIKDGGEINSSTYGRGDAGKLFIRGSESVNVMGVSTGSLEGQRSSKITAGASETSTGNGGSLTIETLLLNVADGGIISSNSDGKGTAGDINITGNIARLNNGQITAQTASTDGGNINFNLSQYLLLRNGSQISTTAGTAQAGGNGGNININSKFIIANPEENSDISANAYTGSGGKVKINSQGIFGIQSRTKPTEKSDITASSELGISGITNINAPDTSYIQNSFTEFSPNVIDTNALIANSCISRSPNKEGTFFITGSGALRNSPNDASISIYSTGEVRSVNDSTSRPWKKGDLIVEPQGVYRLADGRLVLSRECQL